MNFATINVLLVPYVRILVFEIRKIVACYEIQAGFKIAMFKTLPQ